MTLTAVGIERDGSVIWDEDGYRYTQGLPPTADEQAEIYAFAAALRVGSGHEETPIGGDDWCGICGIVDGTTTTDNTFHPEAFG